MESTQDESRSLAVGAAHMRAYGGYWRIDDRFKGNVARLRLYGSQCYLSSRRSGGAVVRGYKVPSHPSGPTSTGSFQGFSLPKRIGLKTKSLLLVVSNNFCSPGWRG